jgi:hypothetical protein
MSTLVQSSDKNNVLARFRNDHARKGKVIARYGLKWDVAICDIAGLVSIRVLHCALSLLVELVGPEAPAHFLHWYLAGAWK